MTESIKNLEADKAKIEAEMQKKKEELYVLKCQLIKIQKAIKALQ